MQRFHLVTLLFVLNHQFWYIRIKLLDLQRLIEQRSICLELCEPSVDTKLASRFKYFNHTSPFLAYLIATRILVILIQIERNIWGVNRTAYLPALMARCLKAPSLQSSLLAISHAWQISELIATQTSVPSGWSGESARPRCPPFSALKTH